MKKKLLEADRLRIQIEALKIQVEGLKSDISYYKAQEADLREINSDLFFDNVALLKILSKIPKVVREFSQESNGYLRLAQSASSYNFIHMN